MAVQSGIIQFRGKLGRVVGMKNGFKSSGSGAANFMRQLADQISNPRTSAQMEQRVKMLPAVLFNRQLTEVIHRAWEGVDYGGPSTRKFMQYAMKEPWANVPQLPKDSTVAIPGAYLISRGSLPTIGVEFNTTTGQAVSTLNVQGWTEQTETIGNLTSVLLETNGYLREGDQLTFIVASTNPIGGQIPYVIYNFTSIYLDSTSDVPVSEAIGNVGIQFVNYTNKLALDIALPLEGILVAAAVVLSRDGATTYQRSTQRMALNTAALSAYFANTMKESIADTYRTSSRAETTDWPYQNDGETPQQSGYVTIQVQRTPSDGGTVLGAGRYREGDTVNLQATPAEGFTFGRWMAGTTTLSTSANYSFTAASSMTIVAEFTDADRPG